MRLAFGETHIYFFFIPLSVGPWDSLVGEACQRTTLLYKGLTVCGTMGLASGETHIYFFFIPLSVGPWDSLVGEACERQCSRDMLFDSILFCYAMLSVGPWDSLVGEACQRTTLLYRG